MLLIDTVVSLNVLWLSTAMSVALGAVAKLSRLRSMRKFVSLLDWSVQIRSTRVALIIMAVKSEGASGTATVMEDTFEVAESGTVLKAITR